MVHIHPLEPDYININDKWFEIRPELNMNINKQYIPITNKFKDINEINILLDGYDFVGYLVLHFLNHIVNMMIYMYTYNWINRSRSFNKI